MDTRTPVWFITAASSGFGKHIALEALSRGHKVIATARSTSRLTELAEKGAFTIALDVTWPLHKIVKVAKSANDKYGYINHVVNAAGYAIIGAVEESTPEDDLAIFTTNVFGTLNVCKALLPHLRSSSRGLNHRTIANFGSIASWTAWPGTALYSGTKFAISGISEGMRAELAPLGIAVTVIEPGFFRTNFLDSNVLASCHTEVPDYIAVREFSKVLEGVDGNQPGDVAKGSKVIVDVLLMEGGKEVPKRICVGSDARGVIGGKCEETLGLLAEWEGVVGATDCEA